MANIPRIFFPSCVYYYIRTIIRKYSLFSILHCISLRIFWIPLCLFLSLNTTRAVQAVDGGTTSLGDWRK